jgi:hypothetical protein
MPSPGLSLVGFLDQTQAISHLRTSCVPADSSDAALIAEWRKARDLLGTPFPFAGLPDIQDIPAARQSYIAQLSAQPWVAQWLATTPGTRFKLVEIDRLLTYQRIADVDQLTRHHDALAGSAAIDSLLPACLPKTQAPVQVEAYWNAQSVILKARGLALRAVKEGLLDPARVGICFGAAFPLTQVVRFNGRYYMHNGVHRAVAARSLGATHIPCALRDVADAAAVGIKTDGSTFSQALMESPNPPTLGHFTQGRAHPVRVRAVSRVLHVSWSEYAILDE